MLRCLLLFAIGFIVRIPALQGVPVWDDDYLVTENPFAKSPLLIPEAFRHYLFPEAMSYHYRPVQNISFALDYFVWNTSYYGYHLTNVLLHLGSGVLLFLLLKRLLPQFLIGGRSADGSANPQSTASGGAFLVALLWIVHPVHSAAVDYISGRADSLAFLFACGGWLLCLRARNRDSAPSRSLHYVAAMLCGLLALCSREIAAIWLGLFLLHTFAFDKQLGRRAKIASLICCLALLGSYAGLRQLPEHQQVPPRADSWSAATRAVLMLRALGDYGRLMAWPSTLYMERTVLDPENYLGTASWRKSVATEYLSILGAVVLAGLLYGARRKGPGKALRVFGLLWFAFGFLPVSNLLDLNATVAEHWLYLPSVGLLIFAAGCTVDLPGRARRAAIACAVVAGVGLSARSYVRSSDWVTPKTFYQRTIAAGGSSTRVAVNLGLIYLNDGEHAKAEAVFRRVLQLTPDYPLARNSLADALHRQGKRAEAEALFAASQSAASQARKESPRTWMAALNLARMRYNEQNDPAALKILDQARADYPETWQIIRFHAQVLRRAIGPEPALRVVAEFAEKHWWHHGATIALGQLLADKGDIESGVEQLRFASWLDVHDAEALRLIAALRLQQNRLEEARTAQQNAVARQPDEPRQYAALAEILFKMGRESDAKVALEKVASLEAFGRAHLAVN